MLKRLLSMKDFCSQINEDKLEETECSTIKTLANILKPATIVTKKLQYEQLTMANFYVIWKELKLNIKKLKMIFQQY